MKSRKLRITAHYGGESGSASVAVTVDSADAPLPSEVARLALALLVAAVRKPEVTDALLRST